MTGPPRRATNGRAINGVKALPGAASSHGTGLLLQLGSDFLEEPSCSIGEGSGADIARFGIAAEAPIVPKSDPIARIHSVFGIDQMLQGLHVDFPSGLLDRFGGTPILSRTGKRRSAIVTISRGLPGMIRVPILF
jgi:hypothetical protein